MIPPSSVPETVTVPDALAVLVADLADADDGTERGFRLRFGRLSEEEVRAAHEKLRRRRATTKRSPILSEKQYALVTLAEIAGGALTEAS